MTDHIPLSAAETCARCGQHEQYGCACTEAERLEARCEHLLAAKEAAEAERDNLRCQLSKANQNLGRCEARTDAAMTRALKAEAEAAALRDALEEAGQALTEIERLYYTEGKDASWRAVMMRAVANATLATLDQPKEGEDNDG